MIAYNDNVLLLDKGQSSRANTFRKMPLFTLFLLNPINKCNIWFFNQIVQIKHEKSSLYWRLTIIKVSKWQFVADNFIKNQTCSWALVVLRPSLVLWKCFYINRFLLFFLFFNVIFNKILNTDFHNKRMGRKWQ